MLAVSLALVIGSMVAMLPTTLTQANADGGGTCKFTGPNQRCDLDFKKVNGGVKVSIENNISNGGGGNTSNVDQVARDGVTSLTNDLVNAKNQLSEQNQTITNLETERVILTDRVNQLADLANTQTEQIANLTETLNNAIFDVNVTQTDTTPITPPPVINETGNVTG
jgi:hypothetical protein